MNGPTYVSGIVAAGAGLPEGVHRLGPSGQVSL